MIRKLGLATAIAGTLDLVANFILWGAWKQVPPIRICQSIASGIYGKAAFDGGYVTAAVGVVAHFVIMLIMAIGYYVIVSLSKWARAHWGITAVVYGLVLWAVMNYAVVPMSAAARPYPWPIVWDVKLAFNLFCHIGLVGFVFALVFRRSESSR